MNQEYDLMYNQMEAEKDQLKEHMMKNKFEWLKDGANKSSEYSFSADGTYSSTTSAATNGTWKVLDANMF